MTLVGWRWWGWVACMSLLSALTGCASVTHGTTQAVKIDTLTAAGEIVNGAECRVANDKGDTVMRSGQSVTVRRSGANLSIECTQQGQAAATGHATSRVNVGMVGNILIGGLIGVAIDAGTGAGFNYPSWMQLVFGEVRTFDTNSQSLDQPTAGLKIGDARLAAALPPAPAVAPSVSTAPTAVPVAAAPVAAAPVAAVPVAAAPLPVPVLVSTAPATATGQRAEPPTRVSMDDLKALLPARP